MKTGTSCTASDDTIKEKRRKIIHQLVWVEEYEPVPSRFPRNVTWYAMVGA
jgi:hypothetical protein